MRFNLKMKMMIWKRIRIRRRIRKIKMIKVIITIK